MAGDVGGGTTRLTNPTIQVQEVVTNPESIPQIQVGPLLKLYLAMDITEEMTGEAVSLTDDNHPFCMSYHLKVVCNSN